MKAMIQTLFALGLLATAASSFAAQGIVTLVCNGAGTSNKLVLAQNDVAILKNYYSPWWNHPEVRIEKDGGSLSFDPTKLIQIGLTDPAPSPGPFRLNRLTIAGPATITLSGTGEAQAFTTTGVLLTLEVHPQQFPPDRAATVAPYSGSVRVTMQDSTDLVNWTASANGATYTNSPDARFFRIKMDKLPSP